MQYSVETRNPATLKTDCLIMPVTGDKDKIDWYPELQELNKQSQGKLEEILDMGDLVHETGKTLMLLLLPNLKATRLLLVFAGKNSILSTDNALKIVHIVAAHLQNAKNISKAVCFWHLLSVKGQAPGWLEEQTVLAVARAGYKFTKCKSSKPKKTQLLKSLDMVVMDADKDQIQVILKRAQAISNGITETRNLGNLPSNLCTPSYLANFATNLATKTDNMTCNVLHEKQIAKLKMGAFLSVAAGSEEPACLIVLKYKNTDSKQAPIALVGKGVTFDTGGISLKPSAGMGEMKYDMCGAASVLGIFHILGELQPELNVVGIIPTTENMPSGKATKPGDIVTSMSGQTIEVLNTDAEGRLILCDALTYCIKNYNPKYIVDIATLTGACVVALGAHASGLYASNDELAEDLLEAGKQTHDRAWRMPLWKDYDRQINSKFADISNIGGKGAGSVTAACFLARFTKNQSWAHLDVAGTAWTSSGPNQGATGRPTALLAKFLLNHAKQDSAS